MDNKVHISYRWTEPGQGIVRNWLFPTLNNSNLLGVLDVHDCCYMESIMDFERAFGSADLVIIVVSREYIDSPQCLFEATSIVANQNYRNRILLINLEGIQLTDGKYCQIVTMYSKLLLQAEYNKKKIPPPSNSYFDNEIEQYTTILNGIAAFALMLRDCNGLNFTSLSENNFQIVVDKIWEMKKRSNIVSLDR